MYVTRGSFRFAPFFALENKNALRQFSSANTVDSVPPFVRVFHVSIRFRTVRGCFRPRIPATDVTPGGGGPGEFFIQTARTPSCRIRTVINYVDGRINGKTASPSVVAMYTRPRR